MKKVLEFIMIGICVIMMIGIHIFVGVLIYETIMMINLQGFSETIEGVIASIVMFLLLFGVDSLILYDYLY